MDDQEKLLQLHNKLMLLYDILALYADTPGISKEHEAFLDAQLYSVGDVTDLWYEMTDETQKRARKESYEMKKLAKRIFNGDAV